MEINHAACLESMGTRSVTFGPDRIVRVQRRPSLPPLATVLVTTLALLAAACGADSTDDRAAAADAQPAALDAEPGTGIRLVAPADAAAILDDAPTGLVVLDVRTADEFAGGHLAGATVLDFYADDFADRLAELDRDAPYLIYCRSGNRSGQTRALMDDLGFADVADVEGGILAWAGAGLPVTP